MYENLSDPNLVSKLLRKIDDLERMDFFEINVEKISNFRWFFSTPLAS